MEPQKTLNHDQVYQTKYAIRKRQKENNPLKTIVSINIYFEWLQEQLKQGHHTV